MQPAVIQIVRSPDGKLGLTAQGVTDPRVILDLLLTAAVTVVRQPPQEKPAGIEVPTPEQRRLLVG